MAQLLVNSDPLKVDWQGQQNYLFLNPRWSEKQFSNLVGGADKFLTDERADPLTSYVILASSGTTQAGSSSQVKLKCIQKKHFLQAARSFNSFFNITAEDRFLRALPVFHVGGLALYARAFLAKGQVIESVQRKWNPDLFCQEIKAVSATRVSLVPTQVFDLVQGQLKAPDCVNTVFVGGAALSPALRNQAVELGWPLLASYGMTETSSMVASQHPLQKNEKDLEQKLYPLPGVKFRTDENKKVFLQAPGILSYELSLDVNKNPHQSREDIKKYLEHDELETQDYGLWNGEFFQYLGRQQDLIKISGELVSLSKLQTILEESLTSDAFKNFDLVLLNLPEARCENELVLAVVGSFRESQAVVEGLVQKFNEKVLPFEKIKRIISVKQIPRTDLGKVLVNMLREEILKG